MISAWVLQSGAVVVELGWVDLIGLVERTFDE
jgi:hypothetical protein